MTVKEALKNAQKTMQENGVENPDFDTLQFAKEIFSLDNTTLRLLTNEKATDSQIEKLKEFTSRRISGEPIQYILGYWEFMGRKFFVGEGVLIPRDDTEVVVEACIDVLKSTKSAKVIDLCSGSGIIAITLKSLFPSFSVSAVEKSEIAFSYLNKNCEENDVNINAVLGDITTCFSCFDDECFDLLVSNPPYVKTTNIDTLQKEIAFEPKIALDGGDDGLFFYRSIIENWKNKIKHGGYIAFEFDDDQSDTVKNLLLQNGFDDIKVFRDIQDLRRAIIAKRL
ncbi:MAG: peptide chain release factor N(5)-glutamine methyltransferase [Oscillospiraceae bacterium]|nr:peptide chain release factor N(5)-glutamine methyltransferase [Candidatus Ruminococcus equi]